MEEQTGANNYEREQQIRLMRMPRQTLKSRKRIFKGRLHQVKDFYERSAKNHAAWRPERGSRPNLQRTLATLPGQPDFDIMRFGKLVRLISRSVYKPRFEGKIPEGGVVLAANHQTEMDPFLLIDFANQQHRRLRFLAKSELFGNSVVAWILRSGRHVPVYRDSARAKEALAPAISACQNGECVALFPEGMLTQDPAYWPMTARPGAAVIALTAGVPLVPVLIDDAWKFRPCGWGGILHMRWKHFHQPVIVKILDPVDVSDLKGVADAKIATERLMQAITEAMAEYRHEPAPPKLWDMRRDGRTWFW